MTKKYVVEFRYVKRHSFGVHHVEFYTKEAWENYYARESAECPIEIISKGWKYCREW